MSDLISVILSTYSESVDYIKCAVESILNQTYRNIHLIVICDKPDNRDSITMLQRIAETDDRIEFLINEQNLGLVKSLNLGLSHVKGNYVARMDADDIAEPTRFEKQMAYLKEYDLDLVGCNLYDIDENGRIISSLVKYPADPQKIRIKAKYSSPLAHPTWLGKRSVFERLNGYQNLDACEDYDFLIRAIISGVRIGAVQEPLFNYRLNANGISSSKRAKQKTGFYFVQRNYHKNMISSEESYYAYMNANEGKKRLKSFESFYQRKKQVNDRFSNSFVRKVALVFVACTSRAGIYLLANTIKEKMFV